MKILLVIFLLISLQLQAQVAPAVPAIELNLVRQSWALANGTKLPISCSLFRKRVSAELQRRSELQLAVSAFSGKATRDEWRKIIDLARRSDMPTEFGRTAIVWSAEFVLPSANWADANFTGAILTGYASSFMEWPYPDHPFPPEFLAAPGEQTLKVQLTMDYYTACLMRHWVSMDYALTNQIHALLRVQIADPKVSQREN